MEMQSPPLDLFATGLINLESRAGNIVGGGRYSLVRVLGRGGMGIVWLAQDARLNSEVALKFLPPQIRYDSAALDDLRRETARSRKLSHPNIIRIHDLYEAANEDAFISMEYIEGRNLADLRVDEAKRVFSWTFLKPLVEQLCAGLEYAHGERIIHCDLKPANLMLDRKGRLKLADFGIARNVSDCMTRNSLNQTSGTLLYMSPQQMEGGVPHVTDDIYALGATLYELLTGKPPFYTGDIMHQVRIVSPRPMQERLKELGFTNEIPAEIEQVIMACLSKNAAHCPQSAGDVSRLLNGEKIETRTRRPMPRLRMPATWKEKKWQWVGLASVALGVGLWTMTHLGKTRNPKAHFAPTAGSISISEPTAIVVPEPLPAVKKQTPVATVGKHAESIASVSRASEIEPSSKPVTPVISTAPSSAPPKNAPSPPVTASITPAPTPTKAPVPASEAVRDTVPVNAAPQKTTAAAQTSNVPAVVLSKATALQLLQKGNTHVSARSQNRVLEITSGKAPVDQPPQSWQIRYYDDKTTYNAVEVRFEGGEMERVYEPNRLLGIFAPGARKILDLAKVKVDSDKAIRIAAAEAKAEELIAKSVELKLERGYGGLPVWNVKLFGIVPGKATNDSNLGYVIVLAEDGKVLKKALPSKGEKSLSKK
jgi:serine/threonine protein kinase